MRLITPPLPAASRPSNTTTSLSFLGDDPVLQLDQLALQAQELGEVEPARERVLLGELVSFREQVVEIAVLELELEVLVETVLNLSVDAVLHRAQPVVLGRAHRAVLCRRWTVAAEIQRLVSMTHMTWLRQGRGLPKPAR